MPGRSAVHPRETAHSSATKTITDAHAESASFPPAGMHWRSPNAKCSRRLAARLAQCLGMSHAGALFRVASRPLESVRAREARGDLA
jgi:hypothetical protein